MREKTLIASVIVGLCLAGTTIAQEVGYAHSGLMGGFDALFLKAYGNGYDQMVYEELSGDGITPGNDLEFSPRLWFGYVGPSGFGARARWFQYQHDLKAGTGVFIDGENTNEGRNYLDVYAVDIDFMQRVGLGHWGLNGGAGIRAGGVKRRTTIDLHEEFGSRFEGLGPTIFAEFKRPIMDTKVALVANARGAILFGDGRWTLIDDEQVSGSDIVVTVGEVQLGVEYARQLGHGTTAFAQCLWEGQLWSNTTQLLRHREDLGLMGIAINFGISR